MLLKNFVRLEQTGDATIETGEWRCTISFSSIGEFLKQMDFYFPLKSKHLRLAASISRMSKSVQQVNLNISSNGHLKMRFLNISRSKLTCWKSRSISFMNPLKSGGGWNKHLLSSRCLSCWKVKSWEGKWYDSSPEHISRVNSWTFFFDKKSIQWVISGQLFTLGP